MKDNLKPEELLHSIPVANRAVKVRPLAAGALVTVPLQRPRWVSAVSWLFPISKERRIELDLMGSQVLALCDGRRTVEDVIQNVGEKYQLSFQEARVAVLQFMQMLIARDIIAVIVKGPQRRGAEDAERAAKEHDKKISASTVLSAFLR